MKNDPKALQGKVKFLSLWKEAEDWHKLSLLHALQKREEFHAWPNDDKIDFLLSVLQKNAPSESNLTDEKFKTKREIFTKTFILLLNGRYDYYLFYNRNKQYHMNKIEKKLITLEKILKLFEKIQYPYYTSSNNEMIDRFFFKKGPAQRALSSFLQHIMELNAGEGSEEENQLYELSIKVAIQSFNIDLLKKVYRSNYYGLVILDFLKKEYHRCIKIILEKEYYARPGSEEEKIFKEGKFSEKIYFLLEIHKTNLWIPFLLQIMALEGDFDKIKI
jgi:hypothetical protein